MAIRSVADVAVRAELLRRMESLRADARPAWGSFTAPRMLAHLNNALRMGLGELPVATKPSPVANRLGRWLLIYRLPWPKGTPTAPELLAPPRGEWEAELAEFRDLLERSGTRPAGAAWPPSRLRGDDGARLGRAGGQAHPSPPHAVRRLIPTNAQESERGRSHGDPSVGSARVRCSNASWRTPLTW